MPLTEEEPWHPDSGIHTVGSGANGFLQRTQVQRRVMNSELTEKAGSFKNQL